MGDFQLSLLIHKKLATDNFSVRHIWRPGFSPERLVLLLAPQGAADLQCDHRREMVDSVTASGHSLESQGSSRSQSRLWGSGPSFVRKQQRMGRDWARRPPSHVYAKNLEDFLLCDPKWW